MAKLHEYQSKALLRDVGIPTPKGGYVETVDEARALATAIGGSVVIKAQVWTTGRAGKNLVRFADTPDAAAQAANELFAQKVGDFTIDKLIVEERVQIEQEIYLGLIIDDKACAPIIILSSIGGSGIEDIVRTHPDRVARHTIDPLIGLREFEARDLCRRAALNRVLMMQVAPLIVKFYDLTRRVEARSAEINPLALTPNGLVALDGRFTIDDYAAFRHPELGIEIAREFDRPPTALERAAWQVEKDDYRGTFYFIQMKTDFHKGEGVVGFHGNGGGGAMITMDALLAAGFQIANFVDTSGNPPASKVYRAARLILRQPGIDGYFLGGSGVASQEQYHTARGLVKAFMDAPLTVPAVIRIGGNGEEQAIRILQRANGAFLGTVEAFGRDSSPDECAVRLHTLIDNSPPIENPTSQPPLDALEPYSFETSSGGTITYDYALCRSCESKACVHTCDPKILSLDGSVPVLNITRDEAKRGGCTECLACEVECYFLGNRGGRITLPIPEA